MRDLHREFVMLMVRYTHVYVGLRERVEVCRNKLTARDPRAAPVVDTEHELPGLHKRQVPSVDHSAGSGSEKSAVCRLGEWFTTSFKGGNS
jgi:hypothetical protein